MHQHRQDGAGDGTITQEFEEATAGTQEPEQPRVHFAFDYNWRGRDAPRQPSAFLLQVAVQRVGDPPHLGHEGGEALGLQ
jgi:hypothetical protein